MKFNNNILDNRELLRDLLKHVDLFNTINGGTAMTFVDVVGSKDSVVIEVSAPTIGPEAFNILLNYPRLTISIWAKEDEDEYLTGRPVLVPMFVKTFELPALVDLDHIEAVHEEGLLKVILPFNDTTDDLLRMIDIKEV